MENNKKVLLWEPAEEIEKSRELTEEAVGRFNQLLAIYNKWDYDPLTVEHLTALTLGQIDPVEMIKEIVARNATQLKKLKINQDAIKGMVELPDNYDEFATIVDQLRAFNNQNSPPIKPVLSNYMVVFDAIHIKNGRAQFNGSAFDKYADQLRVFADNETQKELSEHANAAAKHLSKLCEKLAAQNIISAGWGDWFVFQDYFITDGTTIRPRYTAISALSGT